ncbi:MAG TPA: hypothetical protein VMV70_09625 [Gallionella sp.]|nr:hypothetical protein [Gallionella sp.]
MSIKLRSTELSPAEASFLKWQYGFDEEDAPFERALWQAIVRAWEADNAPGADESTHHLERLGSNGAYPEEVELYLQFKSEAGDVLWNELIRRAALADRRTTKVATPINRRRSDSSNRAQTTNS